MRTNFLFFVPTIVFYLRIIILAWFGQTIIKILSLATSWLLKPLRHLILIKSSFIQFLDALIIFFVIVVFWFVRIYEQLLKKLFISDMIRDLIPDRIVFQWRLNSHFPAIVPQLMWIIWLRWIFALHNLILQIDVVLLYSINNPLLYVITIFVYGAQLPGEVIWCFIVFLRR